MGQPGHGNDAECGHDGPPSQPDAQHQEFAYGITAVGVFGAAVMLTIVGLPQWWRRPNIPAGLWVWAALFWTMAAIVLIRGLPQVLARQRIILDRKFINLPQRRFIPRDRQLHYMEIKSYSVLTARDAPRNGRPPRKVIVVRTSSDALAIDSRLCSPDAMLRLEQWLANHAVINVPA
jgi:hypothetical protein